VELWVVGLILAIIAAATVAFIWVALKLGHKPQGPLGSSDIGQSAENEVEHIFNKEFREELRNRGRLHFEKIIGENAMFLQQDLQLTTAQINDFMKSEITGKLKNEFTTYEQSISDAKQMAIDAIQRTNAAIDEQRKLL